MALKRAVFCWALGGSAALAEAPLSAIDWLSDSIDAPVVEMPAARDPLAMRPAEVTVLSLDAPLPDAAGLIDGRDLGLDPGLWGQSAAADLARGLADLPGADEAPPSVPRFLRDLLTARLEPPVDAVLDDAFYLARIDRLLTMGHLAPAAALIEAAGAGEPERFRRAFDIALLNGTETEACGIIEATPDLSPTYPTRIFCLARLGQWEVAALTLGNAEALGILSAEEDALLRHFLDPELFEGDPLPAAPRLPTPLLFRLFEAVGERMPTDPLPVAFAVADLDGTQGWKARLHAMERLTAAEARDFEALIEVFFERKPAASGGIWERVAALQAVVPALKRGRAGEVSRSLSAAWIAARQGGYEAAFARWAAPRLKGLDLTGAARHLAFEMALLAGLPEQAAPFVNDSAEDRFLLALARGQGSASPGAGQLHQAVSRGMAALQAGATFEALLADDRAGEALLRALKHLKHGASGNPQSLQNALTLLRKIGLEPLARQIAVELVLMEGAA